MLFFRRFCSKKVRIALICIVIKFLMHYFCAWEKEGNSRSLYLKTRGILYLNFSIFEKSRAIKKPLIKWLLYITLIGIRNPSPPQSAEAYVFTHKPL